MDLVLVRHAESIWNAEGRWQGQTDVPLSTQGRRERKALGARLRGLHFDRVVCSDLMRTRDTLADLGEGAPPIELDAAFREMFLGSWQGLLDSEVRARFPDDLHAMNEGEDRSIGGGESMPQFQARANGALQRVVDSSPAGARVLVMTHGGVVRAILTELLGMQRSSLIGAGNTSMTHLRIENGSMRLASYNCTSHLPARAHEGDEILDGPDLAKTIAHIGLAAAYAARLAQPAAGTKTHLAHGNKGPKLRAFAVPCAL